MYARGKFGIEYTPSEPKPESPWLGRVLFAVALVAAVFVMRAIWKRVTTRAPEEAPVEIVAQPPVGNVLSNAVPLQATTRDHQPPTANRQPPATNYQLPTASYANRPVKVRNLLLRLKEAEGRRDVEMAISTIEQLRDTPGVADLDDKLARQLGALNFKRLFDLKSAQWTIEVKAKRGDSATRIAYEHGSTLASLIKLNTPTSRTSQTSLQSLRIGQRLVVMNHPRFSLVISRRTRTADLSLNGKFFKRYYLTGQVKGAEGSYETPERFRNFCAERGVPFKPLDRAELEMLLPKGTAAFIKEI